MVKKCLKPTTTNDNNVNQNCHQWPPKTTHLLVELHAGVLPQVWGPRAPILWVLEKITTKSFHLHLSAKIERTWKSRGMTAYSGIAPHKEVRIAPPNAHIEMIQPMATMTNKDHTKQQASTRKARRGALGMTKGEVGKETPRTTTTRTVSSMPRPMWTTNPVTYLARIITRRNSMTRLPRRGTTTQGRQGNQDHQTMPNRPSMQDAYPRGGSYP